MRPVRMPLLVLLVHVSFPSNRHSGFNDARYNAQQYEPVAQQGESSQELLPGIHGEGAKQGP